VPLHRRHLQVRHVEERPVPRRAHGVEQRAVQGPRALRRAALRRRRRRRADGYLGARVGRALSEPAGEAAQGGAQVPRVRGGGGAADLFVGAGGEDGGFDHFGCWVGVVRRRRDGGGRRRPWRGVGRPIEVVSGCSGGRMDGGEVEEYGA
jgi:hypothetical protein